MSIGLGELLIICVCLLTPMVSIFYDEIEDYFYIRRWRKYANKEVKTLHVPAVILYNYNINFWLYDENGNVIYGVRTLKKAKQLYYDHDGLFIEPVLNERKK